MNHNVVLKFAQGLFATMLGIGAAAVALAADPIPLNSSTQALDAIIPLRATVTPEYHVARAAKPPTLDAKLDEWADVAPIALDKRSFVQGGDWTGPEDLNGSLKILWDDNGLYFALDVTDNVVVDAGKNQMLWQTDCTQIVFDSLLNGRDNPRSGTDTNYVITRDATGTMLATYTNRRSNGAVVEEKIPDARDSITFARRDGGYVYEWFLPWSRLPFVSPYLLGRCGFNFSLNDDDGKGFRGAMAWTRGLMFGFDPGRYGQIIFDGALGTKDGAMPLPPGTGAEHQEAERNRWLNVKDLRSLKSAGIILQSTRDQQATATVKIYESDQTDLFATSQVNVDLKAGKAMLVKWDLSTLPLGRYDVVYESSLSTPAPPNSAVAKLNYDQLDEPVLPASSPAWIPGYRVRYALQVLGDLHPQTAQTIVARLPTGGWLKEDASDLVVQRADGSTGAVAVLSHDPKGDTIVQFRRNGMDRWYWVYASNPNATPPDPTRAQKLADAKAAADAAMLGKMGLLKASADRAAALRDMNDIIERETKSVTDLNAELAEWAKLLPDRQKAATDTAAAIAPLQDAVTKATEANAPTQKIADEKTAGAKELTRGVDAAKQLIASTPGLQDQTNKKLEAAKQTLTETQAARTAADAVADAAAKAQAIAAADAKVAAAQKEVDAPTAALTDAAAKLADAQNALPAKEAAAKAAEDEAVAARLAAAPSGTALQQAQQALAAATAASTTATTQLKEATDRIAAATALRDKSTAKIAEIQPQLPAAQAAADQAKAAADNAGADAQTKSDAYITLAGDADPTIYQEGLTVEFRRWEGDQINSWPAIVEGLKKSAAIQGNGLVTEVMQNMNPFHREDARNFAAIYRGNLKIDLPGIYSFYVNGDDAAFIFIDGYKVYSRTGSNYPLQGRVPLYSIGSDIQLEKGVHTIEVYHVVGNSPNAIGMCGLMWLPPTPITTPPTPDAKRWLYVPRTAFVQPILAVPAKVEAFDGAPLAVSTFGIDDVLSADGITVYLTRFAADDAAGDTNIDPQQLTWTFSDGTEAHGPAPSHLFFSGGDFDVSLKSHAQLPPFVRRVHMWTPPSATNPLSLARAVEVLAQMDPAKLDPSKLDDAYYFLRICEQPTRWPVMERVCRQILTRPNLDLKYRAILHTSLLRALAEQGHGEEALKSVDAALAEVGKIRTLGVQVQLAAAAVEQDVLKDYEGASKRYQKIIDDNSRLRHPLVRQAAVAWGDMCADAGDLARAGEAYRLARSLGGPGSGAGGEGDNDPVKRGALLRVAEQQLKEGNVAQTTRLLWRIEAEFPEQKIEGLYRYLRAESERTAGRYDQAIRNYEALLNLRQWASYRPQAIQGTADSYYRMGDYPRALEWLTSLQKSYPEFFDARKLKPYRRAVEERLRNAAGEGAEVGGRPMPLFASYDTGFELTERFAPKLSSSDPGLIRIRPSTGLDSPRTLFMDVRLQPQPQTVEVRLPALHNFPTQGAMWVEVWYRDESCLPTKFEARSITADVVDSDGTKVATATTPLERSFGQWQKIGFKMQLPLTQDGEVTLTLKDQGGYVEFDGVRVDHISDGQVTALQRFTEGANPQ